MFVQRNPLFVDCVPPWCDWDLESRRMNATTHSAWQEFQSLYLIVTGTSLGMISEEQLQNQLQLWKWLLIFTSTSAVIQTGFVFLKSHCLGIQSSRCNRFEDEVPTGEKNSNSWVHHGESIQDNEVSKMFWTMFCSLFKPIINVRLWSNQLNLCYI